ncbi:hypothetical protein FPV67DRAFT_1510762, partial [Lyophyllum atratum]
MSPYWMLNLFICAIHFTHALVLKAPQSPTMLGDTLKIIWHSEPGDPPSESDPSSSIPGLNLIPSQIGALPAQTVITANLTSTKNVGTAKATLSLPASISGTPPTTTQAILPSSDTFTPSSTTTQASSETPNVSRNNGGPLGVGVRRMTPLVTLSVVLLLLLDI